MQLHEMELRDYLAAKAMAAIISKIPLGEKYEDPLSCQNHAFVVKAVVKGAYDYADAMLDERSVVDPSFKVIAPDPVRAELVKALRTIAFEPQGAPDATSNEVLEAVVATAREALRLVEGGARS